MGMAEVIAALDGQSVPWESCQLAQMVQKQYITSHIRNVLPLLQQVWTFDCLCAFKLSFFMLTDA